MKETTKTEIFGADIGNYSTEIYSEAFNVLQPSMVAFESTVFDTTDQSLEKSIANIYDNLNVHIKSDYNKIDAFYKVGNAAIYSDSSFAQPMDISVVNKATNNIPIIMLVSLFAARAVEEAYKRNELTEDVKRHTIETKVDLVTAIPASEYNNERAKLLESRLKNLHTATLYFGDFAIVVNVEFVNVKVTEEGKTSMLYLNSLSEADKKKAFAKYIEEYEQELKLDNEVYSLHVDIGNGTTEFTFIKGINPISSRGVKIGIGHSIVSAINVYKENIGVDIDRQSFNKILQSNSRKSVKAKEYLAKPLGQFAEKLYGEIDSAVQDLTKGQMDYLFVHGGGSVLLEPVIKDELTKKVHGLLADLVYVDEKYAPHLNARGCYVLAKILYGA